MILFGSDIVPNTIRLQRLRLSTSSHPAILPLRPVVQILGGTLQREEDALVLLDHRIVTSENNSELREIDSVISEFNRDLANFTSLSVLIATWRVPAIVSYIIVLSCREQIADEIRKDAIHPIELLEKYLK